MLRVPCRHPGSAGLDLAVSQNDKGRLVVAGSRSPRLSGPPPSGHTRDEGSPGGRLKGRLPEGPLFGTGRGCRPSRALCSLQHHLGGLPGPGDGLGVPNAVLRSSSGAYTAVNLAFWGQIVPT